MAGSGPELWTVPATGGPKTLLLRLDAKHNHAAFGTYGPDGTIAYRRTNYDGVDLTQMTDGSCCGSSIAKDATGGRCASEGVR